MRHTNRSRLGFTLIEVMVATTIIGIIAASAILNLAATKLKARNGQRKDVAQTYTKAVGSYQAASGTTFVTTSANARTTTCKPTAGDGSTVTDDSDSACVGADGRSFGMLDYSDPTGQNSIDNTTEGFTYTYSGTSIASALQSLGYLGNISFDPTATKSGNGIASDSSDYLLVRCCANGHEAIGTGGTIYAIWTKLETTSGMQNVGNEASNADLCGGQSVVPTGYGAPTASTNPYVYAFGTEESNSPADGNPAYSDSGNWFAVGNAPISDSSSMVDAKCAKTA